MPKTKTRTTTATTRRKHEENVAAAAVASETMEAAADSSSVGAAVDRLWAIHEERREAERVVAEIVRREAAARSALLADLGRLGSTGVRGRLAEVRLVADHVPTVVDWESFYHYVRVRGAFELLQRRLTKLPVLERMEKEPVPGVEITSVTNLSLKRLS